MKKETDIITAESAIITDMEVSLYFYLQFYQVDAGRGYVYGMIPLILV